MIANLHVPDKLSIGIPNPGAAAPEILELFVNGDANAFLVSYSNAAPGFNLRLAQARGTVAAPAKVEIGDYIFELEAFMWDGVQFQEGSEVKCIVDAATTNGQRPATRLEFWTNANNAGPTAKVLIDSQGKLTTFATANGSAGFNLPHGVVPAAPVNGDLWTTSAGGLFGRINGVTQNYAPLASPTFTGTVGAAALTMTGQLKINNAAALISTGTSDGTDNSTLELNGGGGTGSNRGARILLNGNEAGAFGDMDLDAGIGGWINLSINGVVVSRWVDTGAIGLLSNIATTAGGNAVGVKFGTSSVCGIFFGSGAPTITAPQGALYLRTDGSSTITRAYINTTGAAIWTPITTVG